MRYLMISISLTFFSLTGCDETNKGNKMHIFGAMAVQNKTNTMLDVSIVTDDRRNDFGVIVAGGKASMGGGQFELGKKLKVVWFENYNSDNPIKGEAFFDMLQFADIADKIKEVEFVYLGEKNGSLKRIKRCRTIIQTSIYKGDKFKLENFL